MHLPLTLPQNVEYCMGKCHIQCFLFWQNFAIFGLKNKLGKYWNYFFSSVNSTKFSNLLLNSAKKFDMRKMKK